MTINAKTIAAVGVLVTALGGSTTALVTALKSGDDTEAVFRDYRVEIAILNAKVGVLMAKTGVTLDVDVEALKKAMLGQINTWSLFPTAYAQEVPAPLVKETSVMIDGCKCVCPVETPVVPAPVVQVQVQKVPDQVLFKKLLDDQVKKAPRNIKALSD
jgi:hypothetical protein